MLPGEARRCFRDRKWSRHNPYELSKRHSQIEKAAIEKADQIERETGNRPSSEAVKEIVAHEERSKKMKNLSAEELREGWRSQLREAGLRDDGLTAEVKAQPDRALARPDAKKSVQFAVAHLTEREAVVRETDLVAEAVKYALGTGFKSRPGKIRDQ